MSRETAKTKDVQTPLPDTEWNHPARVWAELKQEYPNLTEEQLKQLAQGLL